MRRCQRLPELTHPVDPARPPTSTSKAVPSKKAENPVHRPCAPSVAGDEVTCRKDAPFDSLRSLRAGPQPFLRGVRLTFRVHFGRHLMKVSRWGALTGALVLTAAIAPSVVHGQNRTSVARVWDAWEMSARSARIGITVQEPASDDSKQPKTGVVVEDVRSGSPADKAGVKEGDAILEFDGDRV